MMSHYCPCHAESIHGSHWLAVHAEPCHVVHLKGLPEGLQMLHKSVTRHVVNTYDAIVREYLDYYPLQWVPL